MSESQSTINPYAPAPSVSEQAKGGEGDAPDGPVEVSLARTARRWLIVCSLSALPSFVFGFMVTGGQIAGMTVGILIYVIGYTWLDYKTARLPFRRIKRVRRTLRVAYGTRIAISVIFPIGGYLDILSGIVTLQLLQIVAGYNLSDSTPMSFWPALVTTVVQGAVLNVVLGFYALLVYGVQWLVAVLKR